MKTYKFNFPKDLLFVRSNQLLSHVTYWMKLVNKDNLILHERTGFHNCLLQCQSEFFFVYIFFVLVVAGMFWTHSQRYASYPPYHYVLTRKVTRCKLNAASWMTHPIHLHCYFSLMYDGSSTVVNVIMI